MKIKYIDLACSETFTIGQQYDHKAFGIVFSNLKYEGDLYIKIKSKDYDNFIPLQDGTFIVGLPLTLNYGLIDAQLYSKKENTDEYVELSKVFHMRIKQSLDGLSPELPYPVDPNIELLYDDILALKKEIEQKLENGEFNGKDGVGIKSIEKTGSEGLVDTYKITFTDNSTYEYTITNGKDGTNGEDGIDGKSAYELAVENGFEGTEEEWLESLRFDHSDEFEKLAEQVKQDAQSSADNATKAENAMNEANTTAQENVEAINQASTNAQNAITTAKGNAVQAVQSAQQTAENAIGTKQTEAVQAVDTAKTSATQEITEQKDSAISAITQERSEAIEAIETGKTEALNDIATNRTGALNDIATAKDNAIEEIENTGVPLEDIEKLAIKETTQGNPTIISDSADWRLQKLNVYGQSEQDSTTGAQLINDYREGVDNGVTWKIEGSFVSFNGTIKDNSPNGILISRIPFKQETNKTYYAKSFRSALSVDITVKKNDDSIIYVQQYTIDGTEKDIYMRCMVSNTNNQAGLKVDITGYIALTENSAMSEWEPYTGGKPSPSPDYPQEIISKEVSEIRVTGANLIKYPYYNQTLTSNGITFTVNDDQSITINGTNNGTGESLFRLNNQDKYKIGDIISTSLLSDKNSDDISVNVFYVGRIGTNEKIENYIVNNEENSYDLIITIASGATIDNITVKVMRNYGATLLPYEPYKSQTITLSEPITLRGIPVSSGENVTIDGQQYFSDVICENDGVIGVERNINEILVSSIPTNNSTYGTHTNGQPYLSCIVNNSKSHSIPISDRYIGSDFTMNNGFVYIPSQAGFVITDNRFTDKETALNLITEEQTKVAYILNNPTFDPLPEEVQAQYKALKSYYPNTVIQTGCWNEVEYVADTKLYIQKKINEVASTISNIQNVLIGG